MIPYQWTSAAIGLLIAGAILYLVRRDHLHGPYAVWWLAASVVIVLVGLFPQAVNLVAHGLGISYPPILPVFLGMGLILIKMLTQDLERSRQELHLRRLTQRIAILEALMDERGIPAPQSVAHRPHRLPSNDHVQSDEPDYSDHGQRE
ncbi:DUF2304 domain-containing protein [Thioalkalivibrio paradoxus]|uniref:DUF2304 domain-containing protein n=1 Tax=Thioalkalivibrio paradoxus ARh 1 TaxID=713585 RepID=W0DIQ7_9GAMM|nr:DUF2304 domain-containing protein [Thioalkalivibrio paradoxus]AHE98499.1 hypothetical protein THITH_09750 [Thioalkalivibrio paradoxus ARh 1]